MQDISATNSSRCNRLRHLRLVPNFLAGCGNIMRNTRKSWRPTHYMIRDVWCMGSDAQLLMWLSVVKLLGRYQGRNGQIDIVEGSWDGTRDCFEEGMRRTKTKTDAETVFTSDNLM